MHRQKLMIIICIIFRRKAVKWWQMTLKVFFCSWLGYVSSVIFSKRGSKKEQSRQLSQVKNFMPVTIPVNEGEKLTVEWFRTSSTDWSRMNGPTNPISASFLQFKNLESKGIWSDGMFRESTLNVFEPFLLLCNEWKFPRILRFSCLDCRYKIMIVKS